MCIKCRCFHNKSQILGVQNEVLYPGAGHSLPGFSGMAAHVALLLLIAVLGPSLSVAWSDYDDYDSDYDSGSNNVSANN